MKESKVIFKEWGKFIGQPIREKNTILKYTICVCTKQKNNKAEAENCTQNIFMILIENWDKLEDRDIYAWLLKTTQHTLMNLYRKKKRRKTWCNPLQAARIFKVILPTRQI